MGKRNRSKPTAPEVTPATPEGSEVPPRASGDDLSGKPSPAQDVPTGLDPEDARSLRKAAVFFVSAIALIVVLKLLLGW